MKQKFQNMAKAPRFLQTAIRQGLKMADSIGIEKADDGSRLTITFKRFPKPPAADLPQKDTTK